MLLQLFFGYFALVILSLALIVVTRKNLIHAVMWMLLMFIHIAGLYLLLNAEFFAIIQIIVYAGAILVMFLFIVLLLKARNEEVIPKFIKSWQARAMLILLIFSISIITLQSFVMGPQGDYTIQKVQEQTHMKTIGLALYNDYLLPFMIIGLILFVPMIAIASLTLRRSK